MNPNTKEIIERCAHESHAGLLIFPEVLSRLVGAGVEAYFVDYRDQSTTYYLSNNEPFRVYTQMPNIEIQLAFDIDGVVLAIRGAQSDTVRYPEFLSLTMSAGCIGYMVWLAGRRVSYFGRRGEVHVEHFPSE